MKESRRHWIVWSAASLGFLIMDSFPAYPQGQTRSSPKAVPYPNGRDPNRAPELDEPTRLDPKTIASENQKKLRVDVSRLYEMAADLKSEVERTDATATLSVSLIKKAQEIEKLAKQVRNLAKGLS